MLLILFIHFFSTKKKLSSLYRNSKAVHDQSLYLRNILHHNFVSKLCSSLYLLNHEMIWNIIVLKISNTWLIWIHCLPISSRKLKALFILEVKVQTSIINDFDAVQKYQKENALNLMKFWYNAYSLTLSKILDHYQNSFQRTIRIRFIISDINRFFDTWIHRTTEAH